MSNEKKIKPVEAEEVRDLYENHGYSLFDARDILRKRNIQEYIGECETVDDLKKVLHILIERAY